MARFSQFLKTQWRWVTLVVVTAIVCAVLLYTVFWPAFKAPENRTFASKYGYAEVQRKLDIPFEVRTSKARFKVIEQRVLGEGLMANRTVLVPVVPTTRIEAVLVEEGDIVEEGQLLARLEDTRAQLKLRSNELALTSAEAELKRVEAGSAYILAQERPEEDAINLESARQRLKLLEDKERVLKELVDAGGAARITLIELQREIIEARGEVYRNEFNLKSAEQGADQSLIIARNAVEEARNAMLFRELEIQDYEIFAPADGIIERVLIYAGEYNQDTGRPAFVLASDLWFESHFDQTSINQISEADSCTVYLEAYPGQPFNATIEKIIPVVTYNLGGPETNRPIRPRGTGAPEWPATFKARIHIESAAGARLVPGLTGFARIENRKRVLAIPKKAVVSMSAGHGIVHVVKGNERELRKVKTGISDNTYIEVLEGLQPGEEVIVEGHKVLEEDDAIDVQESS